MRIVVTGGCGFIGSSFVHLCVENGYDVLVIDKLTYAVASASKEIYSFDEKTFRLKKIATFLAATTLALTSIKT